MLAFDVQRRLHSNQQFSRRAHLARREVVAEASEHVEDIMAEAKAEHAAGNSARVTARQSAPQQNPKRPRRPNRPARAANL